MLHLSLKGHDLVNCFLGNFLLKLRHHFLKGRLSFGFYGLRSHGDLRCHFYSQPFSIGNLCLLSSMTSHFLMIVFLYMFLGRLRRKLFWHHVFQNIIFGLNLRHLLILRVLILLLRWCLDRVLLILQRFIVNHGCIFVLDGHGLSEGHIGLDRLTVQAGIECLVRALGHLGRLFSLRFLAGKVNVILELWCPLGRGSAEDRGCD